MLRRKVVEMTKPSDRTDTKERSQVKHLDRKRQGNEKYTQEMTMGEQNEAD